MNSFIPIRDLDEVITLGKNEFDKLKDSHIFITGGTGYFGKWLLYSIDHANKNLLSNIKVTVPSRSPEKFYEKHPYFKNNKLIKIENISLEKRISLNPTLPTIDYIIHAAANVITSNKISDPTKFINNELNIFENILDLSNKSFVKRILFTSSGAAYGARLIRGSSPIKETDHPLNLTPYGEVKVQIENRLMEFCRDKETTFNIARCFAFMGPGLDLKSNFAVSNFLMQIHRTNQIIIKGSGNDIRSFLYMGDLTRSLLRMLTSSSHNKTVNVGASKPVTIKELAELISSFHNKAAKVIIENPNRDKGDSSYYLPQIDLARDLFDLRQVISLEEATKRTYDWSSNHLNLSS